MKGKKIVLSLAASLGAVAGLAACKDNVEEVTKYNVIFMNGDEVLSETEVVEGEYFAIPSAPAAAEGYYFAGWDGNNDGQADDVTKATADITYKAVFEALPEGAKTVTFKNGDTIVGVVLYNSGDEEIVEPQVPAKAGYTGSWEAYELNGEDIVVNASYVATRYFVNYVVDGVTISRLPFTVENPQVTAPQVPAKEGYSAAWETYSLDGVTSDIYVNAVYTANPLTINDFLGVYKIGEETITVTPTEVEAYIYDDDFGKLRNITFESETNPDHEEYFAISGNTLGLYSYSGTPYRLYQLVDGSIVSVTDKVSVSAWGTYEYKVDGVVKGTLKIDEDGVSYVVGDTVYDSSYTTSSSSLVIIAGDESLTFELNSNNNYELTVDDVTEEFVKVIPTEWYGTYYYAQNYPTEIVISDATANDIKIVKDGFEYQGTTFVPSANGGFNYIGYDGKLAGVSEYDEEGNIISTTLFEYVKLENKEIPESIYGTYRGVNTYTDIVISAEGITIYSQLIPMDKVTYSVGSGSDSEIALIAADTYSFSMTDGVIEMYGSKYYKSSVANTSSLNTTIPAVYDSFSNKLYASGDILFEISDGSITYSALGYESLKFFVDEDNKIHIFKNKAYAASDEVIVEIVDGKLMIDGVEFVAFNVSLADIAGTYLNGDDELVINAEGVEYAGETYPVADIEISVYDIKLSADVTLVYNPDNSSITAGDKVYNYSYTLSLNIPEEMYGTYYNLYLGRVIIDKSGITFADSWSTYSCTISVSNNVYSIEIPVYNEIVSYDDSTKEFSNNNYTFVKLPDQTIPSTWVAGTYVGECEVGTCEIIIDSSSITFVDPYGQNNSSFIITSENNEFSIGDSKFVYNVDTQTITGQVVDMFYDSYEVVFTMGNYSSEEISIPTYLYGTWSGTDPYEMTWEVSIDESSISVSQYIYGSWMDPLTDFEMIDDHTFNVGDYTFTYDENQNTITISQSWDPSYSCTLMLGGK